MVYGYVILAELPLMINFVQSIYFLSTGNFDASKFPLSYYMDVPFDTTTIWGWYLLWFIQCAMSFNYGMGMTSTTSYFLCCCLYIDTIRKHINFLFATLKDNFNQIQNVNNQKNYHKLCQNIQANLHEAIDLHVKIIK